MNILVDICHTPHVNFFKHAIAKLKKEGHTIFITYLQRGSLPMIVQKEFYSYPCIPVGKHRGTSLSIIFEANVFKFFRILLFCLFHRIHFGLSVGSFTLGFALKILGRRNVQFDDDPERGMNVWLEKLSSDVLFFPPIIEAKGRIRTMNALKEWAYLAPSYFTPNQSVLTPYDIQSGAYFFIREIDLSLNYISQERNIIASVSSSFPKDIPILLSLENKSSRNTYPDNWILLQEPLEDIHSLIYYSKALVSSGDSMVREAIQMGVPAVYCGNRKMKANKLLLTSGLLFHLQPEHIGEFLYNLIDGNTKVPDQEEFREKLNRQWDDISELITTVIQ